MDVYYNKKYHAVSYTDKKKSGRKNLTILTTIHDTAKATNDFFYTNHSI